MDPDIDTTFAEMTADLDLEIDSPPQHDDGPAAPFAVNGAGDIDVNIDSQIRSLLLRAARILSKALTAAELTALPAPGVDGDPTDEFAGTAAQTLNDIRVERLAAFEATAFSSTITPAQAHLWIAAANDIRLHLRGRIDSGQPVDCAEDGVLEALTCDLAGAVSHTLIATLRG